MAVCSRLVHLLSLLCNTQLAERPAAPPVVPRSPALRKQLNGQAPRAGSSVLRVPFPMVDPVRASTFGDRTAPSLTCFREEASHM